MNHQESLDVRTETNKKQRQSSRLGRWMVRQLICRSQWISQFRARGGYSGFHRTSHAPSDPLAKSKIEFEDHENALANFSNYDLIQELSGKRVLDFGCGYGGRTVWMAQYAEHVEGIEVRSQLVDTAKGFAEDRQANNVGFRLSDQQQIPYPDNHFDVAVSFDVLEHVADPRATLDELVRVVKPGGTMVLVFTPYFGIFSHHLNYISLFPGLHWFFSPHTLVDAVNDLLEHDPRFANLGVGSQPSPHESFNGRKFCLPTLNGLTRAEYIELVAERDLESIHFRSIPVLERFSMLGALGRVVNSLLHCLPLGKEMFSHNLVSVLKNRSKSEQATRAKAA